MLRQRAVKIQPVGAGGQGHGGLPGRLGLQARHLLRRQVGGVGDDQVQPALGQRLPVGEQVPFHHLHRGRGPGGQAQPGVQGRLVESVGLQQILHPAGDGFQRPRQGAAGVQPEIRQGLRAFFQADDPGVGPQGFHPQAQAAGAGAEVQHPGVFHPVQQPDGRLGHHLGVGAGAEDPRPHRQLKGQKGPPPADVLQRLPAGPAGRQLFQAGGFLRRQRPVRQPGVPAGRQPEQLPGVKAGVRAAGGFQAGFHLGQGLPGGQAGGHHRPSSGRSGSTGLTASMATSIMLSSGSKTVSRWTHRPGCRTMRLNRLSDRPHHLSTS